MIVLDPCCGTGAYLRAVLRRIAATLQEKGGDALMAHDLKGAAMERVFGFEILPAPLVIAHLQIGLELETLGALRQDWPRVPLPDAHRALEASAALGRQVAALLDVESSVPGITCGKIREELKDVAVFRRLDGKPARPAISTSPPAGDMPAKAA